MIVAPSILSLDYANFNAQCELLNQSKAEWIHFDVMDGHFVPNLTFGTEILKGFKKACPNKVMDVHFMVEDPNRFIEPFMNAGADVITVHHEVFADSEQMIATLKRIRSLGMKAGVSVKPKTFWEAVLPYIECCDLLLVMSVEPGFGGQSFMEDMLVKVEEWRKLIDERHLDCVIEIDGGINCETAKLAVKAGVDVLVAGSYVFKGDILRNVDSLVCLK